jgi:hypothetical protein
MKKLTSGLAAALLVAAVVPSAAIAQTDTTATAAAAAVFPPGTAYEGVAVGKLRLGAVSLIAAVGTAAGHFQATLLSASEPTRSIEVEGRVATGLAVAGTATFSGLCTVDMGEGAPPAQDVPFTVTLTRAGPAPATVVLVLGSTTLAPAIVDRGSITVE